MRETVVVIIVLALALIILGMLLWPLAVAFILTWLIIAYIEFLRSLRDRSKRRGNG